MILKKTKNIEKKIEGEKKTVIITTTVSFIGMIVYKSEIIDSN